MPHSSVIAWGYLILFGGIAIVILGIVFALRSGSSEKRADELMLKKRLSSLESLKRAGQISRDEYNRRRTEILVERYKKHAG